MLRLHCNKVETLDTTVISTFNIKMQLTSDIYLADCFYIILINVDFGAIT